MRVADQSFSFAFKLHHWWHRPITSHPIVEGVCRKDNSSIRRYIYCKMFVKICRFIIIKIIKWKCWCLQYLIQTLTLFWLSFQLILANNHECWKTFTLWVNFIWIYFTVTLSKDLTALEIEVKGESVPLNVVLHPYAVFVPGQYLVGTTLKNLVTVGDIILVNYWGVVRWTLQLFGSKFHYNFKWWKRLMILAHLT